jgi:hypothetical protein
VYVNGKGGRERGGGGHDVEGATVEQQAEVARRPRVTHEGLGAVRVFVS